MLIDTNILIYALNIESEKCSLARSFLAEHATELVVAHQNITESLRVLTHPKLKIALSVSQASQAIFSLTNQFSVIRPQYETLEIFHQLLNKYQPSGAEIFDAYLVATALSNSLTTIATDNLKHFQHFEEITVMSPFTAY